MLEPLQTPAFPRLADKIVFSGQERQSDPPFSLHVLQLVEQALHSFKSVSP